ncbi:MAG TPA: hypothetical protein V6D05_17190 [Stenomitos sp.]
MAQQDLPFSRDLGYLDKFLTSLRAHAESLGEPRRSELLRLVNAEVATWGRIRTLLAGQAPADMATPAPATPIVPRGLTVGSLMPGR